MDVSHISSHDLRTTINRIRENVELYKSGKKELELLVSNPQSTHEYEVTLDDKQSEVDTLKMYLDRDLPKLKSYMHELEKRELEEEQEKEERVKKILSDPNLSQEERKKVLEQYTKIMKSTPSPTQEEVEKGFKLSDTEEMATSIQKKRKEP